MSSDATAQGANLNTIIDVLALFKLRQIEWNDIDQGNRQVLSFYIGLMDEDKDFAAQVHRRMNQLNGPGRKTPLFSPEDLKKPKKKRKPKARGREYALQLNFWPVQSVEHGDTVQTGSITDPESNIFNIGKLLDKPTFGQTKSVLTEEIRHKRLELRNLIGLPIARGKNPHVNDPYYKFLVKRIYTDDQFGIFRDYDRVYIDIPEDLSLKIQQIKNFIDDLLNENLTRRQFFRRYDDFFEYYQNYWNIPM